MVTATESDFNMALTTPPNLARVNLRVFDSIPKSPFPQEVASCYFVTTPFEVPNPVENLAVLHPIVE